jgi:hypothetical protein
LKGIGLLTWLDILDVLGESKRGIEFEFQRFVAAQAEQWLSNKIDISTKRKNDVILDRTGQYRYSLTRVWNSSKEKVVFICLNPSTADGENDDYIVKAVRSASLVVVAWGEKGIYRNRHKEVSKLLSNEKVDVLCLEILKCNQPKHPLYAKKELTHRIFAQ